MQNSFGFSAVQQSLCCLAALAACLLCDAAPLGAQANVPKNEGPGAFILNAKRAFAVSIEAGGELTIANGTLNVFSNHPAAIRLRDLGSIQAKTIAQAPEGGVLKDDKQVARGPAALPLTADPWTHVTMPELTGLKSFGDVELKTERVTLQPGIYDSLIVGSLAQAQLAPGLYVFKNTLEISSRNGVQGENVTLINQGRFVLNGLGTLRLSSSKNGPLQGIAFYQERANKKTVQIEGGATMEMFGALYLPSAYLEITGNGKVACTQLVADSLRLSGNGKLLIR